MARIKRVMQSGPAVRGKGVSLNQDSVKSDDPFYTGDSNVEIIEATIFAKIVNYLVWASLFVGVAGIVYFMVRAFSS